ncbi:Josephin-domain-containing protein [Pisolithus croceorrhizus]|nr:Josephin-domain-containing protein [Pisolithus croceorrhizus]KAI6134551.1 Josephin-domain-containing protein [Pisolithus croceorrhizus]
MAGLDRLLPLIYHEGQQEGSMLCAQHALNSLLQENHFTAPDLSDLARNLDALEHSYNTESNTGGGSMNMDDTGYFSVQVLESALNVFNLSLVRWRSEAARPYRDKPHTQLAFILNHNHHWYTLRRFGLTPEGGHWFNLDSSEPEPRRIGKTYLAMVLQQAEQNGYSVFVVTPTDSVSTLPRTRADEAAESVPEPSSNIHMSSATERMPLDAGYGDEDMDLQAALQASLADGIDHPASIAPGATPYPPPLIPADRDIPGVRNRQVPNTISSSSWALHSSPPVRETYGNADPDPLRTSMERNRIIMERMRREQEMALREQYEAEAAQFGSTLQEGTFRSSEQDEEDEHIRRAIAASLVNRPDSGEEYDALADDGDDEDGDDYHPTPPADRVHRVYDDDDADLQAALKASLENVPHGFTLPASPAPRPTQRFMPPPSAPSTFLEEEVEVGTESDTEDDISRAPSEAPKEEELSVEEIRRRRLARFGG